MITSTILIAAALIGPLNTAWWSDETVASPPSTALTTMLMMYHNMEEYDGVIRTNTVDNTAYNLFPNGGTVLRSEDGIKVFKDWSARFFGDAANLRATNAAFKFVSSYTNFSYNMWFSKHTLTTNIFLGGVWTEDAAWEDRKAWGLYINSDSKVRLAWYTVEDEILKATNSTALSASGWNMVTLVYNATNLEAKIYINSGNVLTVSSVIFMTPSEDGIFTIGNDITELEYPQPYGYVDGVAFWTNRVLTATEVSYLYNSGTGIDYPFTP